MATVIAFTSGKGGVGKTNISTNLGLSLVARGKKVCLFDADTGLANINILMGITPSYTIEHVLNGQKTIAEITLNLSSGISVVPAASGIKQCSNLNSNQISILISSLKQLEQQFDYLMIDTAAGIDNNVLDFVASAQYRVIVITPEPTSLTDSFALLKMLVIRGKKRSIFILVNRVKDYKTSQIIFKRFQQAVKNYLKIDIYFLGYLASDDCVNKAITQQVPVVISYPNAAVSCGFASLADIIKKQFTNDKNLPYFSHYWAQQAKTNNASKQVTSKIINTLSSTASPSPEKNNLADFYALLDQQALTETQLKELAINLETIYEKKHSKPLKDINSTVASILADGNSDHIKKLHHAIAVSFERQFKQKITSPEAKITQLLQTEQFSKNDFNHLLADFTDIYQQRFNETYFSESNQLLTQIQQLLSTNKQPLN